MDLAVSRRSVKYKSVYYLLNKYEKTAVHLFANELEILRYFSFINAEGEILPKQTCTGQCLIDNRSALVLNDHNLDKHTDTS